MSRPLVIASLYPRDMNIYGDQGNLLALVRRARAHGYDASVIEVNMGDTLPGDVDIVLGGGGQDSGQSRIAVDLSTRQGLLQSLADDGVPMLLVCGMYQLFGHQFVTHTGAQIEGIGVLDVDTRASAKRLIGNVVATSEEFGEIIGYENHSGYTVLGPHASPLGQTAVGTGNNPDDGTEGARFLHVIGTYLHGALLPKNPAVADYMIEHAARRRYGDFTPRAVDDTVAARAREHSKRRPR